LLPLQLLAIPTFVLATPAIPRTPFLPLQYL
jgi:hypothetical protein